MIKIIFSAVTVAFVLASCNSSAPKVGAGSLKNAKDSASYMLGLNQAQQLKQNGIDEINEEMYRAGLAEGFAKDSGYAIDLENSQEIFMSYFTQREKIILDKNKVAADKFIADAGKKAGVVKLNGGIIVETLKEGMGNSPSIADSASFHFTLSSNTTQDLLDTKVAGYPFPMTKLMDINYAQGLGDAISNMKTGGEYMVYIPYETANSQALKRYIKPGELIVFKITDLETKAAQ